MRIALVHDWLLNLGGAERVLIELHKIFPQAPIYTLFTNKKFVSQYLPNAEIKTSYLQKIPFINKTYKYFLVLMPSIIESLDLSEYDVVISSSVIFSKGLVLSLKTKHICYCYSPTRFLWDRHAEYENKTWQSNIARHILRVWDRQSADRVDQFVAISEHVRDRIKKYYRKEAKVIYPPMPLNSVKILKSSPRANYYLIVSRLYPHKNIDIAIKAFNKLGLELVIIGEGPDKKRLKKIAGKTIKFMGFVPDNELPGYYKNCKAFIMPQEEDFGLTPIEAMLCGRPVLALRKGGAVETIIEGVTGEFFDDPIPEALADGIRRLNENYDSYNSETIKSNTQQFTRDIFHKQILEVIQKES